ncbi:MAG: hypothetical protein BroJett038_00830 [Chloroflexota bacterium]|nr:MAG: hypothetical protein BroJett038_00830 [Chloroflexota bacterium]
MPLEFEALVGHLYIVGSRAISAAPPGALVEVAPKKAARGRELDTFFTLVLPSGEVVAPSKFYEQMATLGAERYFSSAGSVTAGLRAVFNSLNENLTEHNSSGKRRYEASMLCAVLRDDEVYLARVGSGVALLWDGGQLQPFPADFSQDEALFGPPLGVHPVPDIKMAKYTIHEGARLVLADPSLADMETAKTNAALAATDIGEVLAAFKALAAASITLLAVEFVTPETPSPVVVKESESTARVPAEPAVAEAAAAPPAGAVSQPPETKPVELRVRAGLRRAALQGARVLQSADRVLARREQSPTAGRPGLRGVTATGLAVLIPVVIVVLVLVLWLGGTGESEFELCVQEATRTAQVARGIPSNDVTGTLAAWNAVLLVVERCENIRPGDLTLRALTREAQGVIDALSRIERRDTLHITSFPNAALRQVVLQGLELYVLDEQNNWVYRLTLTSDGRGIVQNSQQPIAAMRLNATVGEFRVGNLVDIAWLTDTTQVTALDDQGLLIACSPRFLQSCTAQRLLAAERWVRPVAMTFWQGKLYILDPGANQVWRYEPSGGAYATVPNEYFAGEFRPDIRAAVDFGIDDKGNLYILQNSGEINKYRSGQPVEFAFVNFPSDPPIPGADAMFLNNDPTAQGLYIVSQASRTIYETTLAGTFNASYRAANEADFTLLAGVVADAGQQLIYAISGNSVFAISKRK